MASLWEPVEDYLPWIQEIRNGLEEKAQVLEPGRNQWERKGRTRLPESGKERKIEAQDPESKTSQPLPVNGCRRLPCIIL